MPCQHTQVPGGFVVVCTRGRPSRARCQVCKAGEHTLLCDAPLRGAKTGKTCDRKLCDRCAVKVGDLDLCPAHGRLAHLPCQTADAG
jgi:hypothetical protein